MGVFLSACVTINVYFPAAAAERAADRIIEDVWGNTPAPASESPPPQGHFEPANALLATLADALIPSVQAQPKADIDVDSPAISATKARMEQRHLRLAPLYASATVGLTSDGLVAVADLTAVPLKDRQMIQRLVAEENSDRRTLYAEIARVNNHPEWASEIQATFGRRWIANARPGWLVQRPDGTWGRR
jgi:uncharacterized protein YdbL (DUF1318 family)